MTDESNADEVDVLIITSMKDEYDAALLVKAGSWPRGTWTREAGPTGIEVAGRVFRAENGQQLRVVLARALEIGGVAPLVERYKPKCLAVCGVCAGRRGEVEL